MFEALIRHVNAIELAINAGRPLRFLEAGNTISSLFFCLVHGYIGMLLNFFQSVVLIPVASNANTCRNIDTHARVKVDSRRCHCRTDFFCDDGSLLEIRIG